MLRKVGVIGDKASACPRVILLSVFREGRDISNDSMDISLKTSHNASICLKLHKPKNYQNENINSDVQPMPG